MDAWVEDVAGGCPHLLTASGASAHLLNPQNVNRKPTSQRRGFSQSVGSPSSGECPLSRRNRARSRPLMTGCGCSSRSADSSTSPKSGQDGRQSVLLRQLTILGDPQYTRHVSIRDLGLESSPFTDRAGRIRRPAACTRRDIERMPRRPGRTREFPVPRCSGLQRSRAQERS